MAEIPVIQLIEQRMGEIRKRIEGRTPKWAEHLARQGLWRLVEELRSVEGCPEGLFDDPEVYWRWGYEVQRGKVLKSLQFGIMIPALKSDTDLVSSIQASHPEFLERMVSVP